MPVEGKPSRHGIASYLILICMTESGNMIIMALSYAQKTGDNSQLAQYVCTLKLRIYLCYMTDYLRRRWHCWRSGHNS